MKYLIYTLVWLTACIYSSKADQALNQTTKTKPYDFLFELYTFPFTFLIGTISNSLTFMVMRRKKMRNQSTYFYMGVLAIADECVLIVGCLNFWVYVYTGKSFIFLNVVACKVTCMLLYATLHFSVWVVVIMTIERYIAVALPLQASRLCTVKRAKISTSILALIVLCVNFHFIITHALVGETEELLECKATELIYSSFMNTVWPWIDLFIYASLPVSLIFIFNILILNNLFKASNSVKNFRQPLNITRKTNSICSTNNDQNNHTEYDCQSLQQPKNFPKIKSIRFWCRGPKIKHKKYLYLAKFNKLKTSTVNETCLDVPCGNTEFNTSKKLKTRINPPVNVQQNHPQTNNNRKLTIMLITVSSTFFITSLPIVTLQTIEHAGYISDSYEIHLIRGIFLFLQYVNHSCNFFLYAITGKTFRREFIALLVSWKYLLMCKEPPRERKQTISRFSHHMSTNLVQVGERNYKYAINNQKTNF